MQLGADWYSLVQLGAVRRTCCWAMLRQIGTVWCHLMQIGAPWCTFVTNLKITVQTGATIGVDWCSLEHVGADWCSLVTFGAP